MGAHGSGKHNFKLKSKSLHSKTGKLAAVSWATAPKWWQPLLLSGAESSKWGLGGFLSGKKSSSGFFLLALQGLGLRV